MGDKQDRARGPLRRRRKISMPASEWERLDALAQRTGRERSALVIAMVQAAAAKLLPSNGSGEAGC